MEIELIILAVFFITLVFILINKILNKFIGQNPEKLKEFREKTKNLQERMHNAQILNDPYMMRQLQTEVTQLMKSMVKKQLIPACGRCIVFLILFFILDNFVFFNYRSGIFPFPILFFGSGWAALYFLFAIGLSLLFYGVKKFYLKLTGKEDKKTSIIKQIMGREDDEINRVNIRGPILQNNFSKTEEIDHIADDTNDVNTSDSWKKRIL
ncbi:MAG: hypothetical protein JW891_10615 [Candidatus Lokiarchaeota archaeon]|nr:hypothetical protein [Candidatus Lokiarchaeota archaeon]